MRLLINYLIVKILFCFFIYAHTKKTPPAAIDNDATNGVLLLYYYGSNIA